MRKIITVTPIFGRVELTRLMLDCLQAQRFRVRNQVEVESVVVGSEGAASRALAEAHGCHYVEAPNSPLGAKHNAGMLAAKDLGADGVMNFGSDNFVSDSLFIKYGEELDLGASHLGVLDAYVLEPNIPKLIIWLGYGPGKRFGEPIGAGRCYSAEVCSRYKWRIWEDKLDRNLDSSITKKLKGDRVPGGRFFNLLGSDLVHLGHKQGPMLTDVNRMLKNKGATIEIDIEKLTEWFGVPVAERMLALKSLGGRGAVYGAGGGV